MKRQNSTFGEEYTWEAEDPEEADIDAIVYGDIDAIEAPWEPTLSILDVSHLLNRMVMDIQHLELEVIRARYKLSFFLEPPYDEYLRNEIFSNLGGRYNGDPVYEKYISCLALDKGDEDAIDTQFHLQRKRRLADGYDDYPDLYP